MRDSDWSREILLRSDWSGPKGASITTDSLEDRGIKNIKGHYPHFELEIEQDATRTPVLIKQERE